MYERNDTLANSYLNLKNEYKYRLINRLKTHNVKTRLRLYARYYNTKTGKYEVITKPINSDVKLFYMSEINDLDDKVDNQILNSLM